MQIVSCDVCLLTALANMLERSKSILFLYELFCLILATSGAYCHKLLFLSVCPLHEVVADYLFLRKACWGYGEVEWREC